MAILEANKIPGYKKEEIMKQYKIGKTAELDVGFREPYSTGMTGLKCSRLGPVKNNTTPFKSLNVSYWICYLNVPVQMLFLHVMKLCPTIT